MIYGQVNALLQPIVTIRLLGPSGQHFDYDCIVDTGFSGYLMISPMVRNALSLPDLGTMAVHVAGGYGVPMGLTEVTVDWQGQRLLVPAHVAYGRPLLGMYLLRANLLRVEINVNGPLSLQPLNTP